MRTRFESALMLVTMVAVGLAGCSPTTDGPTPVPATSILSAGPTTAPPEATSAPTTGQTDTSWGRIWDALPAGFPRYPGATTADDATDVPVSAAYALTGVDAGEVATWVQTNLEVATYSTEALSGPFEDGGYVVDSVGDGDCRIQTTIAPLGGLVLVTILYGAACPV